MGAATGKQWIDRNEVDFIQDGSSSAVALAIVAFRQGRDKGFVPASAAASDLTGKASTPNDIHLVYDTLMEARPTGGAMVKARGTSWFFITPLPNYSAGLAFQRDTTRFVESNGGKVMGAHQYPFPETTDFSGAPIEAKASRAKILGVSGVGCDLIDIGKQAHEFGVRKTMNIAAGLLFMRHGLSKYFGFPAPSPAAVQIFGILDAEGAIHVVGGALIVIGLFARAAAFLCSG